MWRDSLLVRAELIGTLDEDQAAEQRCLASYSIITAVSDYRDGDTNDSL